MDNLLVWNAQELVGGHHPCLHHHHLQSQRCLLQASYLALMHVLGYLKDRGHCQQMSENPPRVDLLIQEGSLSDACFVAQSLLDHFQG